MIVVKLIGGLGNQMFQYAFGRYLSIHNNTSLFFDMMDLESKNPNHIQRHFSLSNFNLTANIYQGILNIDETGKKNLFQRLFSASENKLKLVIEKKLHFDKEIGSTLDNVYLNGYWQSPLYFKDIEDTIRKDFTFSNPVSKDAEHFLSKINASNAVSLHVRRGDYVNNPETLSYHGICDIDYYKKAIEIIKSKVSNPIFFIFTDDTTWVQQNFSLSNEIILVSKPEFSQFDDLQLMSACKHAIIANSSFSWWGAWLIINTNKIVIAPLKWLQNETINTDDLFPKTWIRI
jgi:hypothetical protein